MHVAAAGTQGSFGDLLGRHVLQGGDATGRDTGGDYEVTRASGRFSFIEAVPGPAAR